MKTKKANTIRTSLLIFIDAEIKIKHKYNKEKKVKEGVVSPECGNFKVELYEMFFSCRNYISTPSTDNEDSPIHCNESPIIKPNSRRKSFILLHSIANRIKPKSICK